MDWAWLIDWSGDILTFAIKAFIVTAFAMAILRDFTMHWHEWKGFTDVMITGDADNIRKELSELDG